MQETPVPNSCSLRLLAITGEIFDSRTLAIFFFGTLKLLNLIVSSPCTYPALNLEQKAEKALIPFPRAVQLPRPANDIACRESFLVNWEFWRVVAFSLHSRKFRGLTLHRYTAFGRFLPILVTPKTGRDRKPGFRHAARTIQMIMDVVA